MDGDFRLDYIYSLQQELMTQSYSQQEVASCLCYAEQLLNRNLPVLFYYQHVKTIFYKGIMPSEKVLDFPADCNTLTGSVNL